MTTSVTFWTTLCASTRMNSDNDLVGCLMVANDDLREENERLRAHIEILNKIINALKQDLVA